MSRGRNHGEHDEQRVFWIHGGPRVPDRPRGSTSSSSRIGEKIIVHDLHVCYGGTWDHDHDNGCSSWFQQWSDTADGISSQRIVLPPAASSDLCFLVVSRTSLLPRAARSFCPLCPQTRRDAQNNRGPPSATPHPMDHHRPFCRLVGTIPWWKRELHGTIPSWKRERLVGTIPSWKRGLRAAGFPCRGSGGAEWWRGARSALVLDGRRSTCPTSFRQTDVVHGGGHHVVCTEEQKVLLSEEQLFMYGKNYVGGEVEGWWRGGWSGVVETREERRWTGATADREGWEHEWSNGCVRSIQTDNKKVDKW